MTRRKQILIAVIFAVVMFVALPLFIFSRQQTSQPDSEATNEVARGVTITNTEAYTDWLDLTQIPSVETAIYGRVKHYIPSAKTHYDAVIRSDSIQTTYHEYAGDGGSTQVPTVTFLVDIPKATESYKVALSGGTGYPYNILHVLCPTPDELLYGDFGCVDGDQ